MTTVNKNQINKQITKWIIYFSIRSHIVFFIQIFWYYITLFFPDKSYIGKYDL
jgi:hypothetical protein